MSATIMFPCKAGRQAIPEYGTPDRAEHCTCERPALDQHHCVFCGRLPKHTIDMTWRRRAAVLSKRG